MTLVCHVILQDHVTKRSSDFMKGALHSKVTILPSLVVMGTVVVDINIPTYTVILP